MLRILVLCAIFLYSVFSFANSSKSKDLYLSRVKEDNNIHNNVEGKDYSNAELHSKILYLEEKIRDLNGKVQYSDYTYQKIIEKINNLSADINYRLSKIEQSQNATNKSVTKEDLIGISKFSKMIDSGKYHEASVGLLQYIKSNVETENIDKAYYLLGLSYFKQKLYEKAGTYFLKGYKNYPNKETASENLWYLAQSLINLGKKEKACSILQRLSIEYQNRSLESKKETKQAMINLGCKIS